MCWKGADDKMIYTSVKDIDYIRVITVLVDVVQFGNYEDVFNKIKASISDSDNLIILDLSRVKFMDSLSLGMLVPLLLYTRRLGGEMAIVAPDPKIKGLFKLLRLDRIMNIHDSVDEARTILEEGEPADVDD